MHKKLFAFLACMGLALLIATPLKTQAASAWSFQAMEELIEKDGTTTMTYHQYKNFDVLKNNQIVSDKADEFDDYTVVWESSDEDAVWINKRTGQARANKFDALKDDSALVIISAHITNTKTNKQIVRSFVVKVDNRLFTQGPEAVEPTPEITPTPELEVTPTPEVTVTPSPTPEVTPTGTPSISAEDSSEGIWYVRRGIKKLSLGSDWKTDMEVLMETFDFRYGDVQLEAKHLLGIDSVETLNIGDPDEKIFIVSLALKLKIQAFIETWDNPDQYFVEEVEINHSFDIE